MVSQRAIDTFINDMWIAYRSELKGQYEPQTKRTRCEGNHGGDWDRWEWRGDSFDSERAYCADCGKQVRGVTSPWRDAALAAWKRTKAYNESQRKHWLDRTKKTIKFARAGRRTVVTATDDRGVVTLVDLGYPDGIGNKAWFG